MKELKGLIAILVLALVFWAGYAVCGIVGKTQPAQEYTIIDKYEHADKHYIAVEVEVDANDYIGYDKGDEWKPWTE